MIVYMATDTENGKRYVGVTGRSLEQRKIEHHSRAVIKPISPFYKALAGRREKFSWTVLGTCSDRDLLLLAEKEAIDKFKTHVDFGGYNSTIGGAGVAGFKYSEESRAKISASNKARPKTDETRYKLSEANKGKRPSDACLAASAKRMGDPDVRERLRIARNNRPHVLTEEGKAAIRAGGIKKRSLETGRTIPLSACAEISKMRMEGKTLKEIAEMYNCTASAVCYYIKRMQT